MPAIISVGTAVPEYKMEQQEVKAFARALFATSYPQIERLLQIFENSAIKKRHFSRPKTWFETDPSWQEKNQAYLQTACEIGKQAIELCLQKAGLKPQDIDHLIFVSTTGMATPSMDAHLINHLQMKPTIKRTPIWGLGCAGGVVGLARAYEAAKAFPEHRVLLIAVECCSLTFRSHDQSKSNLVATSLFADGAAAVLISGDSVKDLPSKGPQIIATMSNLFPHSLDVMGWDVLDDGLKVIFSRDIPSIVKKDVQPVIADFLALNGLSLAEVKHYVTHPGGLKVLQAYEECLGLSAEHFHHSYDVLQQYGNMSSATVLFVMDQELEKSHQSGSYGLVSALGPGFSTELVLLRWDGVEHE